MSLLCACLRFALCSFGVVTFQAASSMVSVQTVIDTLAALDLGALADPVAAHFCDSGFEDFVSLSNLIKLLRDAGVPPARAIAVKRAVAQSLASPVCCASATELLL